MTIAVSSSKSIAVTNRKTSKIIIEKDIFVKQILILYWCAFLANQKFHFSVDTGE